MENENVSKQCSPYSPLKETRSLFNNPKRSDVRFLVESQTVYGHKVILAMGSPVFERMFFGDLKETQDPIEVKKISLNGFKNALRYIYGFQIDFELSELYDSYWAADYYLLHHFDIALFDYIKDKLNSKNSLLIYEQLAKIGKEGIPLANVRSMIVANSKSVFESDQFMQIDQETLIGLLSLDELNIAEIDLLVAVSKWVDSQVQRQGLAVNCENRRKVFEPIKSYILFTALTPEKIAECDEIVELLTTEERGLLLLNQLNKNSPSILELKTSRRAGNSGLAPFSVFVSDSHSPGPYSYKRYFNLKVNRRVFIQTIYTTYSLEAANLSLETYPYLSNMKINKLSKDGKWCFSFDPPLELDANKDYRLSFIGDGRAGGSDQFSQQGELKYENSTIFNLNFSCFRYDYHCVRGLDFFPSG